MKVYAFDFDGVIADTIGETYLMGKTAYKNMTGKNMVAEKVFNKSRPFIKQAEDYLSVQLLLEKNKKINFESIRKTQKKLPEIHAKFAKNFYIARGGLIKKPKLWFGRFTFHEGVVKLIKNLSKNNKIFIATTRDKESTSKALRHAGIKIQKDKIIDRYFSKNKIDQMNHISSVSGAKLNNIVFMDDIVDHLIPLYKIGVRTILASWGYSTKEHVKEANRLGIPVASLKDIEKTIDFLTRSEYFDVINEKDEIVGCAPRDTCHRKGLLHRSIHVLILNSKSELLMQKRSMKKDLYPGWWIDAAAGHVESGETYEETAKREMKEEVGISVKIEELFKIRKSWKGSGNIDNELITVYLGKSDGPFRFNKDEVELLTFYKPKDVMKMVEKKNVTPATVKILSEIKKRPKLLKRLGLA